MGAEDNSHINAADSDGEGPPPTAEERDRTAEDRDLLASAQDDVSEARDERAQLRDDRAEARELIADRVDPEADADRDGASRDRRQAANDRVQAADDREAASADRELSAEERTASSIDELTGAYRRENGLIELEREVTKAKRTGRPLVLAFIDVDNLKKTNDVLGHGAGDLLLRATADVIRAHIRAYDLVVRFGGDEFLCALPSVTIAEVAKRFALAKEEMATTREASFTVGLAELESDESLEDLIARADLAMYAQRELQRPPDSGR